MSDYVRTKAVRYLPTEKNMVGVEDFWDLEERFPEAYSKRLGRGKASSGYFEVCGTDENYYIDFVLDYEYGSCCGEFGKVRYLTEPELEKAVKLYSQIFEDPDPANFRLVDYCYYNCCEAPDCFDLEEDEFYKEVTLPSIN